MFLHVFYKSKKVVFMFFICELMFVTSMAHT